MGGGRAAQLSRQLVAQSVFAPAAEASRLLNSGLDLLASRRFVALEFIGDDGRRLPVFGRLTESPSLTGKLLT